MIVPPTLLIARRHPPELLEAVDQPFHQTAQPIHRLVKAPSSLIRLVRDRHAHASAPQILPDLPTAVAFVAHHATGTQAWAAAPPSLDGSLLHQPLEGGRLVTLSWREHK